jgi:hypothetical protein
MQFHGIDMYLSNPALRRHICGYPSERRMQDFGGCFSRVRINPLSLHLNSRLSVMAIRPAV